VASNALSNLLRREADIAVRMVRPAQQLAGGAQAGRHPIVAAAHRDYLARAGTPARARRPAAKHRLIGYDRDDSMLSAVSRRWACRHARAFRAAHRRPGGLRRLVAAGAGIGFVARLQPGALAGRVALLPS
jgi:hypothetical protein